MTHIISGCGPGVPRPASTPCHGTRSVRITREEWSVKLDQQAYRIAGMLHAGISQYSASDWSREFQLAADIARKLMG